MLKTSRAFAVVAAVTASLMAVVPAAHAAPPVNKCLVNGTVTYQREPCPSDEVRKTPTIEELNAAEKRKREAAKAGGKVAPAKVTTHAEPVPTVSSTADRPQAADPSPAKLASFRCDGRKYCSQMTSCAEAHYFLANCPGVKMDGDRDGVPCEDKLCGH